ncbi:MAG TPA: TolC family protein [bacterium]|nr:TolC family protein [bacterium]
MSTMNALTAVVLLTAMVITIPATTIQQAVATALEQNPQVKVAANAVRSAEARLTAARAALSPTASASVGASISGSDASTSSSGQARVGASYAVYDSGVREAQIRQAEAQAESSRQALAATQASVAVETGTAFMSIVTAEAVVAVREQALEQARTQLRAAEAGVRAGTVPQADVVRAQSQVATAEFNLIDARGTVDTRRSALLVLLNLPAGSAIRVTQPGAVPAMEISAAQAADAALRRPEVKQAEANVRAAEAGLQATVAQGGVSVSVDAGYGVSIASTGNGGSWSTGISASVPLFDGGRRAAEVEAARASVESAAVQLAQTRLQMQHQAQQALTQFTTSIARAAAAEKAALAARESFRAAEGRYTAGVGTVVEVETARTELVTAEVSLRQAQSDQWTTLVTLRRALGLPVIP